MLCRLVSDSPFGTPTVLSSPRTNKVHYGIHGSPQSQTNPIHIVTLIFRKTGPNFNIILSHAPCLLSGNPASGLSHAYYVTRSSLPPSVLHPPRIDGERKAQRIKIFFTKRKHNKNSSIFTAVIDQMAVVS
jgi:hypothetical protein